MIPTQRISKIRFSFAGDEDIKRDSYIAITSRDMYKNNQPYSQGVFDLHMGTTDYMYLCATCGNDKRSCFGHSGHLQLNYPIWDPVAIRQAMKWLSFICFTCGQSVIKKETYMSYPFSERFERTVMAAKQRTTVKSRICDYCHTPYYAVKQHSSEPLQLMLSLKNDESGKSTQILYPHKAVEYLSRISQELLDDMGIPIHPRKFVLHNIKVPSVIVRPDTQKNAILPKQNNNITNELQSIITINASIPSVVPENPDDKFRARILSLNKIYNGMLKETKVEKGIESLALRIKGKKGRFRSNILGKRVWNMCRSTIVGDPTIKIDELIIPMVFAKTIQVEEPVQDFNRHKIMQYLLNAHNGIYPAASRIIKGSDRRTEYAINNIDAALNVLENGDIILRDLVDGDVISFNRQPSLTISSISAHYVKVNRDPEDKTIHMNVIATPLYNADFDGDAMNLIACANIASRNEIEQISSVRNWFISHGYSMPTMGQVDDSIIGSAELTRSHVKMDKYHSALIFSNTTFAPAINNKIASGRDMITELLKHTPISYSKRADWYKENLAPYIKYNEEEINVAIKNGKHLTGILDKKAIGKGGGIFHLIALEYGSRKALDAMFNLQQMAIAYNFQCGYTIGIQDILLTKEAQEAINDIISLYATKSHFISERLIAGEIIPSIGKTITEFYEEQQINALSIFDDFTEHIITNIDPETNNLFKLIVSGSKGKIDNMFNIMSANGQKIINGERIRPIYGYMRTMAYFPRFDMSPESRGYIVSSYMKGMTVPEYVINAMASRFDLISKALTTSVTGEQNRDSVKNLETAIINNYRMVMKGDIFTSLCYGEDYLDPRFVENVNIPLITVSEKEFEKAIIDSSPKHPIEKMYIDKMRAGREEYRELFLQLETLTNEPIKNATTRKLPINVQRILENTIYNLSEVSNTKKEVYLKNLRRIDEFADTLHYIFINKYAKLTNMIVPDFLKSAAWLSSLLIRLTLTPKVVKTLTEKQVDIIFQEISAKYAKALIAPGTAVGVIAAQCFSEPLVQYMIDAHHRSASGGTSRGVMWKANSVLGADEPNRKINNSLTIPLNISDSKEAQKLANNLEILYFHQFVIKWQVFFEPPKQVKYPLYLPYDQKVIDEFIKFNPLLQPPNDLVHWNIRFEINKMSLILKSVSIEAIVNKLRENYKLYVVYNQENAQKVIIRVYIRNIQFNDQITVAMVEELKDTLLNTIIRGVPNIINANVSKILRSKINEDNSIDIDQEKQGIITVGSNLDGLYTWYNAMPDTLTSMIDLYNVVSDSVVEMERILGIEAGRMAIIAELRKITGGLNHRHYLIYADEMTVTGRITAISLTGLREREPTNIMLRAGYKHSQAELETAGRLGIVQKVAGISDALSVGATPEFGTFYNKFQVNQDMLMSLPSTDDFLDELLI